MDENIWPSLSLYIGESTTCRNCWNWKLFSRCFLAATLQPSAVRGNPGSCTTVGTLAAASLWEPWLLPHSMNSGSCPTWETLAAAPLWESGSSPTLGTLDPALIWEPWLLHYSGNPGCCITLGISCLQMAPAPPWNQLSTETLAPPPFRPLAVSTSSSCCTPPGCSCLLELWPLHRHEHQLSSGTLPAAPL